MDEYLHQFPLFLRQPINGKVTSQVSIKTNWGVDKTQDTETY